MKKEYRFWQRKDKGGIYYVMFRTHPGKWVTTGCRNRDDALLWAERNKVVQQRTEITFKDFATGFFSEDKYNYIKRMEAKNKKYQEQWHIQNQGRLDNYIIPHFGNQLISTITTRQIDDWYIQLKTRSGQPAADSTKNKILNVLRVIMQEAKDLKYIDTNPAKEVIAATEINKPREIFTREELIKMFPMQVEDCIKIWRSLSWYLYFRLQAVCGLRPGEVAALHWEDYYKDLKGIVVRRAIDHKGNLKGIKTAGKGKKEKIGYLDDKTAAELDLLHKEQEHPEAGLIFIPEKAAVIKPEAGLKHLRICAPAAGIELGNRVLYSFRHTFDTELLRKLDRDTVNDLMGHTAYRREYDHRTGEEILQQRQDVQKVINGSF